MAARMRDIAAMHSWLLTDLGVSDVSLVGLGFGGWIAAEMASQSPTAFRRLVLVGAMGIKPPEGDIADQAIVSYLDYPHAGSTTRPPSRGSMATYRRISSSSGTSAAKWCSAPRGNRTCTARRCRICWAACARPRW